MSITINGSGTITGLTAGGLPDGSVTSDTIATAAKSEFQTPSGTVGYFGANTPPTGCT